MSNLIRYNAGNFYNISKANVQDFKKTVYNLFPIIGSVGSPISNPPSSAQEGYVTLTSWASTAFYFPHINFENLFFSGERNFIIDFLFRKNNGAVLFRSIYNYYNAKLGLYHSNGDPVLPPPNYIKPPIDFAILFDNPEDPSTGEDLYDAINLSIIYEINIRVDTEPYYKQELQYYFKLPADFDNEAWHNYSVHLDFDDHSHQVYIDGELLQKELLKNVIYPSDETSDEAEPIRDGPIYPIPYLDNSGIFLLAGGNTQMSELRFWTGDTAQGTINNNAFKRIDYKKFANLLHYYPLNNFTDNNPVQLTDLKKGNHGSMGMEGLTDPALWKDDKTTYPPFPTFVPNNLNVVSATTNSIEISWEYDQGFSIVGFNLYLNDEKYNKELIAVGNEGGYSITDLASGTEYDFEITAVDDQNVESERSELLTASTDVEQGIITQDDLVSANADSFFSLVNNGSLFVQKFGQPDNPVWEKIEVVFPAGDNFLEFGFQQVSSGGGGDNRSYIDNFIIEQTNEQLTDPIGGGGVS